MGIDRIGKGGGAPPPDIGGADESRSPTKTGAVDKAFSVERTSVERAKEATPVQAVDATLAASPLDQLKAGKIDVERYLDLKVDEATKSLEGLPLADLEDLRKMLRDQLATDPGLVDLVRTATGKMPKPPEDA